MLEMVDAHVHAISDDLDRYPTRAPATPNTWYEARPITVEDLDRSFAEAGVVAAVLVQALSAHGYDNRYIIDSAARLTRMIPLPAIDLGDPGCLPVAARLVTVGATGFRVYHVPRGSAGEERVRRLCAFAAGLGLPILLSIEHAELDDVERIAALAPDTTFVLDHCAAAVATADAPGWLDLDALDALGQAASNLLFKVTSLTFDSHAGPDQDLLSQLAGRLGAHRMMWGSNYPHSPADLYSDLAERARLATIGLPSPDRAYFLHRTAQELWRLPTIPRAGRVAAPSIPSRRGRP